MIAYRRQSNDDIQAETCHDVELEIGCARTVLCLKCDYEHDLGINVDSGTVGNFDLFVDLD